MSLFTTLLPTSGKRRRFAGGPAIYTDDLSPSDPHYLPTMMNTLGGQYPIQFDIVDGDGQPASVSTTVTRTPGRAYAIRRSTDGKTIEFSCKDTIADRLNDDSVAVRRSEVTTRPYLEPGVVYRGAQRFSVRGWAGSYVVIGQAHTPNSLGGSPSWAVRRWTDGACVITARNVLTQPGFGAVIWSGPTDPLWWTAADGSPVWHDLVYEIRYGRTVGYLKAWIDGTPVTFTNGSTTYPWPNVLTDTLAEITDAGGILEDDGSYWKYGLYAADGIGGSAQLYVRYRDVIQHSETWNSASRIAAAIG